MKKGVYYSVAFVLIAVFAFSCTKKDKYWSSSVKGGGIPDTPVVGKINDKEIAVAYVRVKKWDDHYSWDFSNKPAESQCDIILDDDAVHFSSKILRTGTFEKKTDQEIEFDDYHAYYHYEQEDGSPMSINPSWAAKIVVASFDKEKKTITGWVDIRFDDGKTQIAGKFSGDLCE